MTFSPDNSLPSPDASPDELRTIVGKIPEEILGLIASLCDPMEAASLVHLWDASLQADQWQDWRVVAEGPNAGIRGAVVARVQPGRLATVWPPRCVLSARESLASLGRLLRPSAEDDFENELAEWKAGDEGKEANGSEPAGSLADRLLRRMIDELQRERTVLVQSILPAEAVEDTLTLARSGFSKLADLLYMQCAEELFAGPAPEADLTVRPYRDDDFPLLCELVAASYEDSLDCPALNGIQTPPDILASYRQTGQSQTSGWRIILDGEEPVGCLIVASHGADRLAELVYMGLRPPSRGKRRGAQLVRLAQEIAQAWGSEQLVLTVDAANLPARRVYERCGFQVFDTRQAFVRRLDTN